MSEDKVDGRLTPAFTRKRHRRQALKEEDFVAKLEKRASSMSRSSIASR
jgi:hypothetical protein